MNREVARRVLGWLALAALVFYGARLVRHVGAGVGGSDSSGYANSARDIVGGRIVVPVEGLDALELPDRLAPAFMPLAHEPGPRPRTMVPFYPPGFSLHVALGGILAGWERGPYLVAPVLAALAVLLTFLLGLELGLSRPLALSGAAMLAFCPVFLFQAVQPMSDVAAAVWTVAAILCARRTRGHAAWALGAGAALGMAVLVRPSDLLLVPALVIAMSWRPRTAILLVAGGLPFALFLALWNRTAFGGALTTGYSHLAGNELAWANFRPRFRHYGYWTVAQLSPLAVIGWLAAPFAKSARRRDAVMLITWFGAFFLFYCFWGPSDAWWYTRYLIPALPALILGFLLALDAVPAPARTPVLAAALLVVGTFEWRMNRRENPVGIGAGGTTFRDATLAIAARVPDAKALVVGMEFSGATRFHTKLTPLRWDQITPEDFAAVRARAAEKGWRIFAILFPHEVEPAARRVPGNWTFLGNVRSASLWELPSP